MSLLVLDKAVCYRLLTNSEKNLKHFKNYLMKTTDHDSSLIKCQTVLQMLQWVVPVQWDATVDICVRTCSGSNILGEEVPSIPGAVHAVPTVRGPLQSCPGAWARGWPAWRFIPMAEKKNKKISLLLVKNTLQKINLQLGKICLVWFLLFVGNLHKRRLKFRLKQDRPRQNRFLGLYSGHN